MSAILKWITPNAENIIVNIARVSNPSNRDNTQTAAKLISYLIKSEHWSPFEMANICIEFETTRVVSAQMLRHRSFTFQEFSQRYAAVGDLDIPRLRRQDLKNRQSSHDDLPSEIVDKYNKAMDELLVSSKSLYDDMLKDGVAKECARMVLPMCSPTTIIMNGTIRSWMHYLHSRLDPGTQLEHRELALKVLEIFKKELPAVHEAFFTPQ